MEVAIQITVLALRTDGREIDEEQVAAAVEEVRMIYDTDVPEVFEGAREILEMALESEANVLIMTHGGLEWSERKIMPRFGDIDGFNNLNIWCFNVKETKSSQWREILQEAGIEPGGFLMVGDNFEEDILPIIEMGGRGILVSKKGHIYDIIARLESRGEKEKVSMINEALREGRLAIAEEIKEVMEAVVTRLG
jgi:FMN phosphatase YigB (HAD superfamily)